MTIAGLTIENGYAAVNVSPGGGGILNYGGSLTVNNCALTNNYADFGGAIVNGWGGALTVSGCTLTGNHFTAIDGQKGGGAIFNYYGSSATVSNSIISGNSGPVYTGTSDDVVSYGDGGGIYNGGSMTLSATTVTQNTAYARMGRHLRGHLCESDYPPQQQRVWYFNGGDIFLAYGASPSEPDQESSGRLAASCHAEVVSTHGPLREL